MTGLERAGLVRTYGQWGNGNRAGVVSDHLSWAVRVGARIVRGELCEYVVDENGLAYPVLCSELIEVYTEDGASDGRCGLLATDIELGSCEGHAEERRAYAELRDAERAYLERMQP